MTSPEQTGAPNSQNRQVMGGRGSATKNYSVRSYKDRTEPTFSGVILRARANRPQNEDRIREIL